MAEAVAAAPPRRRRLSMRSRLLIGILVPVVGLVALNTASLYRQALRAADRAYDRTLLASAKSIGELLGIQGSGATARLLAEIPYSVLEAFEADNRSRIYFRVTGFHGEVAAGYEDLPAWRGRLPDKGPYAALVDFYDDRFRGDPVRMAVLLQPVSGVGGLGVATIQIAETLELRQALARQILVDTLWRQAALVAVIAAVVVIVVHFATRPVRVISRRMQQRADTDLRPIDAADAPRELAPLLEATNDVMGRLAHLLEHQKRFVRDTSHQLRTPLAVLKTQVQSARRGDVAPATALAEIDLTVTRATELANQMLALAKVEQLRQQGEPPVADFTAVVHAVALDLAPLVAERELEFELRALPAQVRAHEWSLRELTRNLLHNAIKHSPPGAPLTVTLSTARGRAVLTVADAGPGIGDDLRRRLFQPFSRGSDAADLNAGSGLGLAICHEIVASLGGRITLDNRPGDRGVAAGLDAVVELPLVPSPVPA